MHTTSHTEEAKHKISEALIGKHHYEEHNYDIQPKVWGIDTPFNIEQKVCCLLCNTATFEVPRNMKKGWWANGIVMYRGDTVNVKFALCPEHNTLKNQLLCWEWSKEPFLTEEEKWQKNN